MKPYGLGSDYPGMKDQDEPPKLADPYDARNWVLDTTDKSRMLLSLTEVTSRLFAEMVPYHSGRDGNDIVTFVPHPSYHWTNIIVPKRALELHGDKLAMLLRDSENRGGVVSLPLAVEPRVFDDIASFVIGSRIVFDPTDISHYLRVIIMCDRWNVYGLADLLQFFIYHFDKLMEYPQACTDALALLSLDCVTGSFKRFIWDCVFTILGHICEYHFLMDIHPAVFDPASMHIQDTDAIRQARQDSYVRTLAFVMQAAIETGRALWFFSKVRQIGITGGAGEWYDTGLFLLLALARYGERSVRSDNDVRRLVDWAGVFIGVPGMLQKAFTGCTARGIVLTKEQLVNPIYMLRHRKMFFRMSDMPERSLICYTFQMPAKRIGGHTDLTMEYGGRIYFEVNLSSDVTANGHRKMTVDAYPSDLFLSYRGRSVPHLKFSVHAVTNACSCHSQLAAHTSKELCSGEGHLALVRGTYRGRTVSEARMVSNGDLASCLRVDGLDCEGARAEQTSYELCLDVLPVYCARAVRGDSVLAANELRVLRVGVEGGDGEVGDQSNRVS